MGRMIWVAIGAAGGVYAYRRGQRLLDDARERGVVGSIQAATGSAAGLTAQARTILAAAGGAPKTATATPASASGGTGAAAARALAQSRAADGSRSAP